VAQPLATAAVERDVLGCPLPAEQLGLGGQLSDEGDEVLVVGVASGFEAEHGCGVGGHVVEVDEELPCCRVEVEEPGGVGRSLAGRACGCGVQHR
jgi:hypothetical protein